MRSYKTTFARIHRKLKAYGFKYADPSWVREATIGMIYQMCLEFKKLIKDSRIEDPSWERPEWIFAYQEEVSDLGMLSTPVEYCLVRVLSNDFVTLKIGDHIIPLNSDELKYPSLIERAIVENRGQSNSGQRFRFRVEGEVRNRKGSLKKATLTFVVTFLPPVWEKVNGKIFYPAWALLLRGRSHPSTWTVEVRDKLWNKLFDLILSYISPAEERQMTLPIPDVLPEPRIKIPELIYEPRFNRTLHNRPQSYVKSLASGIFGI